MIPIRTILRGADRWARRLEDTFLVVVLTAMIGLAAGQIVLRNFFDIGLFWGDELLRLLVLWIAMGGAVAASRADRHINIALLDRYLSGRPLQAVRAITHAFTATVCALLAWVSGRFVATSLEYGDVLLGGVPAAALQAVLPLGFALMAWRHGVTAVTSVRQRSDEEPLR
ncbi:TRAP transporter small permease [Elongatibacter sediminis]|uniref:TRAP transporter small permease protein n=1 Tax=Elongatibacter sediminis TaxID=3119006 RepID=A0AAW9RGB6_9GAMM